ncbi:hypothetical protein PGT21_020276 [Puccinia graminis f. sp. tritici]|uniref:Secreted protein n=1 Tax=Puccinia graminis f. sp. tritici TaxID=56615 RepID=A0A5B0QBP6_PUCGR|nr:hypothetical protein PGT21_020276 [Puccinia graminis f. sp. tritici]
MWAFGLYDSLIILLICTFKFASSTPGCHETGSGKNCHSSSEVNRSEIVVLQVSWSLFYIDPAACGLTLTSSITSLLDCNTVSAAIKAKCCYHGRWDSEVDGCY